MIGRSSIIWGVSHRRANARCRTIRPGVQKNKPSRPKGRAELLAFVTAIGFDSLVESFQVSDLPRLSFLRTFHLAASPEAIVRIIDQRLLAAPRFTHSVLELSAASAPEQLTLAPQEAFQLGITTVSTTAGIERTRRWFEERHRG